MQAKRLYFFCASNKYDFLDEGEGDEANDRVQKLINALWLSWSGNGIFNLETGIFSGGEYPEDVRGFDLK